MRAALRDGVIEMKRREFLALIGGCGGRLATSIVCGEGCATGYWLSRI
jgi:hypothetical protein